VGEQLAICQYVDEDARQRAIDSGTRSTSAPQAHGGSVMSDSRARPCCASLIVVAIMLGYPSPSR